MTSVVESLGEGVVAGKVGDAAGCEIVALAVPWSNVERAVAGVTWSGQIVIDATNAILFPDFRPAPLDGRTSSEVVADLVPGARLVKTANTLASDLLAADPLPRAASESCSFPATMRPQRRRSLPSSTRRGSSSSTLVVSRPAGACPSSRDRLPGSTWSACRATHDLDSRDGLVDVDTVQVRERDCPVLPCVPFTTVNADLVTAEDIVAAPARVTRRVRRGWGSRSSSSRRRN